MGLKLVPDSYVQSYRDAWALPTIVVYCQQTSRTACMRVATAISQYFRSRFPHLVAQARDYRPPRMNEALSPLVYIANGNADTKRVLEGKSRDALEYWMEQKPQQGGPTSHFRDHRVWKEFLTESQQQTIRAGLAKCPDGFCSYDSDHIADLSERVQVVRKMLFGA